MENQVNSKSIMLNYGLILGVISVLTSLTLYATGNLITLGWVAGVIGFIAMIVIIILGIKKFKLENNNILSFGQAVKVGIGIALISAVVGIIYNLIFLYFIEPGFQEQMMEVQRQAWQEANMTAEQIEASEGLAKTFSGPAITSAFAILGSAFFGFIISAIGGAIMKRSAEDGY